MATEPYIQVSTKPCPGCHQVRTLNVPQYGYEAWKKGALIQRALPSLTSDEREALITGYCSKCWDKLWGED